MKIKILSKNNLEEVLTMHDAIDATQDAFLQLANNQATMPLRTPIEIAEEKALSLFMPAFLHNKKQLGIKIVSIFPNNQAKEIPTINAAIVLLDAMTGMPKAFLEAGFLTALRTGAISGLATKLFASENAEHVTILGSGAQAKTQLEAVLCVRDIKKVSIWSRSFEKAEKFAKELQGNYALDAVEDIKQAVKHADIICSATSTLEPLIFLNDIKKNCHINAVGSHTPAMKEIANDILAKASVIVDQHDAALAEAGEIISAIGSKQLDPASIYEIGNLAAEDTTLFKNQLSVFKSVGLAIQDISCAEMAYKNALAANVGFDMEL